MFLAPVAAFAAKDFNVTEGNSGLTTVTVVIESKGPANGDIIGQYQTVDGTATVADNDYIPKNGDFFIISGQTMSNPITLQVVGDLRVEPDETFSLSLFNVINGNSLDPGPYVIHIINDDIPVVTVSSPSVIEGNSGTTNLSFVVTLTTPLASSIQAQYSTVDGTAKSGSDYQAVSGTLVFNPGEPPSKVVNVLVSGDTLFEPDETFTLTVTPQGGAPATGTGTIINDDLPTVSIANASVTEGNSGTTPMTFVVSLSGAPSVQIQMTYATSDGTAKAG